MAATPIRLHPNALRILVLIQGRRDRGAPPPTIRELSVALGRQLHAVHKHLRRLRRLGLLSWESGPNGESRYRTLRANYRFEVAD